MKTFPVQRQRIAVIGAGIAGLGSAWLLAGRHDVTLFEAAGYAGGHTNTVDLEVDGHRFAVDTGFLVFNERTYPNLIALFAELGIPSCSTEMSFSVSLDQGRDEWAGSNLDTVFAQRSKLLSPGFHGMLQDILRFNRAAPRLLENASGHALTLGELLQREGFGQRFRDHYLVPMAAAIWSSPSQEILGFPAATFLRFCMNHGLLQIRERPRWFTVPGGARQYVHKLLERIPDLRLSSPVLAVRRDTEGVTVSSRHGDERFDSVVFATHAPQTLAILADADADERAVLEAVRYQRNTAVLHGDPRLLPRRQKVRAAWNFLADSSQSDRRAVCVSYLLNMLQPLPVSSPVIVTLNPVHEPIPALEHARFEYEHPLLDQAAVQAQARLPDLQGRRHTWFAGAWTGYGFHEDGLKSALRVARDFVELPHWARPDS
ncbi:FAD-dependent oxidoreductase [Laribacter hongkongensis]|uniref:NAD(P)/FAD-dependent oxidoreductase n=1 Tax=Laribacter hongkongensis TaxID=168471 RepID=UPI001EFDFE17|nr:FAD-dependent oxidoreductase [Laribacter hongkongensis]MCG9116726.1 FAD-dependent oxidoreductase [Laribacter hongkongensis]